jgi:hypothetical protein
MTKVPERIYLQWYEDDDGTLESLNETTWCVDKINDDVEYILAPPDKSTVQCACGKLLNLAPYLDDDLRLICDDLASKLKKALELVEWYRKHDHGVEWKCEYIGKTRIE